MTKISENFELKNHNTSSDGQVLANVQNKVTKARNLLICESCLWCASYIKNQTSFTKCPLCYNGEIDCIPIADEKNGFFDYSYSKGVEWNSLKILGADWTLNIANVESSSCIEAKTCGCREKSVKIAYSFVDSYHTLCLDKKDIMLDQIQACERLLKYTTDETDKSALIKEIAELKMTLDLLP